MTITLYGAAISSAARRAATVLIEKQVPFKFIVINLAQGEQKQPEYIAKYHPFGQVPVLEDDGFVVYESRAIGHYIAQKYASQGTPLLPDYTDLKAVAELEIAASVEAFQFDPPIFTAVLELLSKPRRGVANDEAAGKAGVENLKLKLKVYDAILSKRKFLAGDSITVVDLFHLPHLYSVLDALRIDLFANGELPNVKRWWQEISNRPSWQQVKDGIQGSYTPEQDP